MGSDTSGSTTFYHNGRTPSEVVDPSGLKMFGTHEIPGIVTRGVLLDMTSHLGSDPVPSGRAFTREGLEAAAKAAGVTIGERWTWSFHTGYMEAQASAKALDPKAPGIGKSAAGGDTPDAALPVSALRRTPGSNFGSSLALHDLVLDDRERAVAVSELHSEPSEYLARCGVLRMGAPEDSLEAESVEGVIENLPASLRRKAKTPRWRSQ